MSKKSDRNWIAKAIKSPGAFREKAERAGEGTMEYARKKKGAKGRLGRQARLAITLSKMRG